MVSPIETEPGCCPICGAELVRTGFNTMDGIMLEDHTTCQSCGRYKYSYVTGAEQITVGDQVLVSDDRDDLDALLARQIEAERASYRASCQPGRGECPVS